MSNIILTNQEIEHKIKRIAYQIYETFVDEDEVVLARITKQWVRFCRKIAKRTTKHLVLKYYCEVKSTSKNNPIHTSLQRRIL
jgi:pyrimidine operon attenuation protein/uracil phosphoribosyltransferase